MLGHRPLTFDDYLAIARRRIWILLLPAIVVPVLTYLISLKVPSRYTSQTLVLVEQQRVPDAFVKPVVTDQLVHRLATMQEQILSRTRLQLIIEQFGLYRGDVGKLPIEDLVDRARKATSVTPIQAPDRNRANGTPGFYIAFTAGDPKLAQQVCAQITSMFIEQNLKVREQSAETTTDFLSKQLDDAKRKLDEQDAALARFKTRYQGQLPGQEQANLNLLAGYNTQLEAANQSLARMQQEKTYVESLLGQQVSAWNLSQQSSDHPQTLEQQLTTAQAELARAEARYTASHPDVVRARADVAALKKKVQEISSGTPEFTASPEESSRSEPPEIQRLRAQLVQYEKGIKDGTAQQKKLQEAVQAFQARLQLTPVVEEQFKKLTRDYETALQFYNDLLSKKSQASMATDLERRQQGEQFRVMDPPNLPEKPSWPDRPKLALIALLAGIGLGLGLTFVVEKRDNTLRNELDISCLLKTPTLASVPLLVDRSPGKDRLWRSRRMSRKAEVRV